jgi:hypothetical protein
MYNNGGNDSGMHIITATGVPQLLVATSIPCVRLDLRADKNNVGDIVIGGNSVTLSPINGIPLHADEVYNIDVITDAKNVVVVGTAGDIVYYAWWTGS